MMIETDALIPAPFGAVAISLHGDQFAIELLAGSAVNSVSSVKNLTNPLLSNACEQIMTYLQHPEFTFDLPLHQRGTSFQQRVWRAIGQIPSGEVRTYGQLAEAIGSGPRAVANACGANHLPLLIPCHRVTASNGLGGFMQGKENGQFIKQWLLAHEGVFLPGLHYE